MRPLRTNKLLAISFLAAPCVIVAVAPASAEMQFSIYGGIQGAGASRVSGNDPAGVGPFSFSQRWEGGSIRTPIYWGARTTWWIESLPGWGVSFDYSHAKVYADPLSAGWRRLEFTNGLNLFTLNALHRFQEPGRDWTPYFGIGAGVSVPHVEVRTAAASPLTFSYQFGGVALQAQAGVEYRFSEYFSAFTEYKGNYARNRVSLDGGGRMKTDIFTHAFNVGLSFHWVD